MTTSSFFKFLVAATDLYISPQLCIPYSDQYDEHFQKRQYFPTDGKIRILRKRRNDMSQPDKTADVKKEEKMFQGSYQMDQDRGSF